MNRQPFQDTRDIWQKTEDTAREQDWSRKQLHKFRDMEERYFLGDHPLQRVAHYMITTGFRLFIIGFVAMFILRLVT